MTVVEISVTEGRGVVSGASNKPAFMSEVIWFEVVVEKENLASFLLVEGGATSDHIVSM